MGWKQRDERPAVERALDTAAGLKTGSWESVEALAVLAIEAKGRPEAASLYDAAHAASTSLKTGTWASVRALAWLARADRELNTE